MCALEGVSSQFSPVLEPALVIVSAKVVKNWQVKCTIYVDTDDFKQNLKVYITYRNTTLNEKFGMPKGKKMMILKEIKSTNDPSKYLIIISLTSYKNNILYCLSTHETSFVIISRKKR